MIQEHSVTVKHITRETADSVSIVLDISDQIKQDFKYHQGQNITFIKDFDGEEIRRSYSICSSVNDDVIRVGIKRVEGGRFSSWANTELKSGDVLRTLTPAGHFYTELDPANKNHYVAVAAGSGITPILSILKTSLETELNSSFTLIYGNKTTDSTMFLHELEDLENKYAERFKLFRVLSRELQPEKEPQSGKNTKQADFLNGRIDRSKIEYLLNSIIVADTIDQVFLCGPYEMVATSREVFAKAGVTSERIHTELFGTPEDLQAIKQSRTQSTKPPILQDQLANPSQLHIIFDNKTTQMELAREGETILDTALEILDELPFSCKGGVCATCKAKVIEGEVLMDVNYALSEEEVEQGFILTCQAHPVSDRVVVSFDEDS